MVTVFAGKLYGRDSILLDIRYNHKSNFTDNNRQFVFASLRKRESLWLISRSGSLRQFRAETK